MFVGKRGISPLIATVLLIAFAVALGAMIMNWASQIPVDPKKPNTCDDVRLVQKTIGSSKAFCYDVQKRELFFRIENAGAEPIEKIDLFTIDDQGNEIDQPLPGSALPSGAVLTKSLSFTKIGAMHAELKPFVNVGGKIVYCVNGAIAVDNLPDC
ncbi:MAG: archaellin/type IV pilin N-terminal domain-containing protein [archaeon]